MKKLVQRFIAIASLATALSLAGRPALAAPGDGNGGGSGSNNTNAERAVALIEAAATIADGDRGKCDALGDNLSGFIDTNAGEIQLLEAWGAHLSNRERHALMDKYKARIQAAGGRLRGTIEPCATNAKVRAALAKVGIG